MNIRILLLLSLGSLGWLTFAGGSGAALGLLAPLLPIAAVTGHSGLITSGLAGAGLLKLKAAATIAAFLSLRRKKHAHSGHGWQPIPQGWGEPPVRHGWRAVKVSHGWGSDQGGGHGGGGGFGGGGGYGGGGGFGGGHGGGGYGGGGHGGYHRRRRAVESHDGRGETLDNIDFKDYDPSLDEVLQYDQLGCGMRLVCELSATPENSLQDDEKLILELFGRDEKAPNPNRASRGKLSYSYAALLGSHAKDSEVCGRVYGRCPYTGPQVMQSLRDANV